ncbi:MAG: 3-phosphoshikimate 1-carboxyvinyltransferase [Phycisphaerae bacterium]|nr:3-phosphoshikimate 1-carboxyvinyltransferase [Phycisphaerae bacterium]
MGTETELMHVQAARASVQVAVDVPGSKSMTCRALVLAAISPQPVMLRGALRSDDTNALAHAISALGTSIQWSGDTIKVDQGEGFQVDGASVDLGHGGTPARFMLGLACLGGRAIGTVVDGSEQLRSRPMGDMVGMLRELGVSVDERGEPGHLPLCVRGSEWSNTQLIVPQTRSSQFVSALLLVASRMRSGLELVFDGIPTSEPYVLMTLGAMTQWGIDVEIDCVGGHLHRIHVMPSVPTVADVEIASDASSSMFWAAAAAILPHSEITVSRLCDDGQPDLGGIETLLSMGLTLEDRTQYRGPAHLRSPGTVDCGGFPDAAPALAVAACYADGPTRLTGLETLRDKESDRVSTIASELGRAGVNIVIDGDDLLITPVPLPDAPVIIETWDDHRIAMALAILGLRRGGIAIASPECVAKSYPGFWENLARLYAEPASGDTA